LPRERFEIKTANGELLLGNLLGEGSKFISWFGSIDSR